MTSTPSDAPSDALRVRAFRLFWTASTIRAVGSAIAGVAFPVITVTVVHASALEISILSALGVVPYLFLGLIIGALMDRWRRQRALVVTTIGRAIALAVIPVLTLTHTLSFWTLAAVTLAIGVLTLFSDSAAQPLLPRLVPRSLLVSANARLGQSETLAGTGGPALGGVLLGLVGAPILFAFESIITVLAAVIQARIPVQEPLAPPRTDGRHIGHDITEGMRFTYRHRSLRPLALSVHVWFLGNSIVATLFAVFVLRQLALPAWAYGVALAAGGIGGFLGAVLAPRLGARLGAGHAILLGRSLVVLPWLALALVPVDAHSGLPALLTLTALAQFVYCLAMGIEDANDMGYRHSLAPDEIQGRMNATIRTTNRVVFFVGALVAGVLATLLGYRIALGIGGAVFVVAALIILFSPVRAARHEESEHAA